MIERLLRVQNLVVVPRLAVSAAFAILVVIIIAIVALVLFVGPFGP